MTSYYILILTIRQTVISRIVRQTIGTQLISGYYGGDLMDSFQGSRIWWREGCRVGVWKVRRVRAGLLPKIPKNKKASFPNRPQNNRSQIYGTKK